MQCPRCQSSQLRKNGRSSGKQRYLCKACGRQFLEPFALPSAETEAGQPELNGHTPTHIQAAPPMQSTPEASVPPPNQVVTSAQPVCGIAILLLDAENLKLDINAEKYLSHICTYPLQVLMAFANWRNPSMGKQDAELFERGYQLLHVPGGKNSADAQMIAMGASITRHYPDVKEVVVCSSDWLLTNLCNELKNQGITVYRVRRQDHTLHIENRNTGEIHYYSLAMETEVPSFDKFVEKIEALLKAEHESIHERIAQLSNVTALFQERCNFIGNGNGTHSNASSRVEQEPDSIPPVPQQESTEPITENKDIELNDSAPKLPTPATRSINSKEEFEQALILSHNRIKMKSPTATISISHLGTEFRAVYNKSAKSVTQQLGMGSKFSEFLQSCSAFKIKKKGKQQDVVLTKLSLPAEINSRDELEQVLVKILNYLKAEFPQKPITIEMLGSEFHKQYSQSVSGILKQLNLNGTFHQFIHCCSVFKVERKGNVYQVGLLTDK